MATLAPSLNALFNELDAAWPSRWRGLDGWFRPARSCSYPSDHCPGPDGRVRAIDFSNRGINPDFVVSQVIRVPQALEYVIWNRHIWGRWDGYRKRRYTGTSNPHTDHVHVSIRHTSTAWSYTRGWGIALGVGAELSGSARARAIRELDFTRGMGVAAADLLKSSRVVADAARAVRRIR